MVVNKELKERLFLIFWEEAKSTFPAGTSSHTNAILEEDFEKVIDKIMEQIGEMV